MVKEEVSSLDTAKLFDGLRFFRAKDHVPVVAFLGLFDAIDCTSPQYKMAKGASEFTFMRPGPAQVVRHAVSFHDRHLVLDPCLLQEEIENYKDLQDIREIWFPGRHIVSTLQLFLRQWLLLNMSMLGYWRSSQC